jgi:MoxR-like ATPase
MEKNNQQNETLVAEQEFLNIGASTNGFVFMEKTSKILEIGFSTNKNLVLYGPGGHGKSEITAAFFADRGINPYVITMGTGMTTDRMFGGLDIPTFNATGKIEYLVENSFMNHEYVVFEEMFDAPDFILEQLKDILSSGVFRNGTQVFPIKTKFIVCCTNRTREEFSKNMSLKALMERFPLELNVIWDNYTDITYNKLLEERFGEGNVDPIIPFILQEYAKASIVISPRVAITAYAIFQEHGPESLGFIAEFAKKPSIIANSLKAFEAQAKMREAAQKMVDFCSLLDLNALSNSEELGSFTTTLDEYKALVIEFKNLKISDDLATPHSELFKEHESRYKNYVKKLSVATTMGEI